MEEKRWTLEHHTWQGLGGDRQVLEMTGLANRFLSSSYSLSPLSVSFCPHHQFPHHPLKLSDIVFYPLTKKEHITLLPGSQRHSLEEYIRCQKWDSAYIRPLMVSGTLGKAHLLSVFSNAQGRGRLDQ